MPPPAASRPPHSRPRLLVVEAWGIGDVALAIPFLREATRHAEVTLLARPHAEPLLRRFAPAVTYHEAILPWTVFSGKYRLHRWPWRALRRLVRELRTARFDLGVSARPDPRDHALLRLAGATRRLGFPRAGSTPLLTDPLPAPPSPHRSAHWQALATSLDWPLSTRVNLPQVGVPPLGSSLPPPPNPKSRIQSPKSPRPLALIHPGAAHQVRPSCPGAKRGLPTPVARLLPVETPALHNRPKFDPAHHAAWLRRTWPASSAQPGTDAPLAAARADD